MREKRKWGRLVRDSSSNGKNIILAFKVPRKCPLVLLINVGRFKRR
jgi:hypothetical protein